MEKTDSNEFHPQQAAALRKDMEVLKQLAATVFASRLEKFRTLRILRRLFPDRIKTLNDVRKLREELLAEGILDVWRVDGRTRGRVCPFFRKPCAEVNRLGDEVKPLCRAYRKGDEPGGEGSPYCAIFDRDTEYYVTPVLGLLREMDKRLRDIEDVLSAIQASTITPWE